MEPNEMRSHPLILLSLALTLPARIGAALPRTHEPHETGAAHQADAPQSQETYRLRVENVEYGRVEVSVDGGRHYLLIGRVVQAAEQQAADAEAVQPGVVARSGGDGLA